MIIEGLFHFGLSILDVILNILDVLPDIPQEAVTAMSDFFDLIFDNCSLVGFFIPIGLVKVLLPLVLLVANWEHLYHLVMWVIHKIPLSID